MRKSMIETSKLKTKEVADYLHKNYPNIPVKKSAIMGKFNLAWNQAYLIFDFIPQHNVEVTRQFLRAID